MKASQLKNKFNAINKAIDAQIEKIYSLAEDFDDIEVGDMLTEYADKLSDIVITDEDSDTSAQAILDYIDNEVIPREQENSNID